MNRRLAWLVLSFPSLACGDSGGAVPDATTHEDRGGETLDETVVEDGETNVETDAEDRAPPDAPLDLPPDLPTDTPADLLLDLVEDAPADVEDDGREACTPATCESLGAECGSPSDGCGGTLDCGTCAAPYVCGGLEPNRCGCTPGAWTVETVYATDNAGLFSGITTDAAHRLHVSFSYVGTSFSGSTVMYGRRDRDGTWSFSGTDEIVCGFRCTGVHNVIAVRPDGNIFILYHDELFDNPMSVQSPDGVTWSWSYVCPTCGAAGFDPAMAIDTLGRLHALHVDSAGIGSPHYATRGPGEPVWTDQRIDSTGGGYGGSITTDPANGVHAAWDEPSDHNLRYAHRDPLTGLWTFESLVDPADVGNDTAIAAQPDGVVHVLHVQFPAVNLLHSIRTTDGAWTTTVVDAAPGSGQANEMVRAADGRLHAVYLHLRTGGADVVYATRDATGVWTTETVPGTGTLSGGLGLTVDGDVVYVTCYKQDRQDLLLASRCPAP